ncbi:MULTISPECIES: phospholipase D-like domain-containing protein [unclassified Oceanobacillus]|uniref:phospholipase D-like domain-containing protein n=1 Tax=unclassified Oceanobacillus TaxID=2630292 RepID=UPI00300DFE57
MLKKTNINNGVITLSHHDYGYQEVIDDFPSAKEIIIVTFNISKNDTRLLDELKMLDESVSVTFITNLPQRHEKYFRSNQMKTPADRALENIKDYFNQLDRDNYNCDLTVYFCYENHSKIIMTENIAYIGSGNFSDESKNNVEAGIILTDYEDIKAVKKQLIPEIISRSIRYTTSFYTVYMEYVADWLVECNDFFDHLDMGIFTYAEVRYALEEKVLDLTNASISYEKLNRFTEMINEAKDLIQVMILDEFDQYIDISIVHRINKLLILLDTQVQKLEGLLEELASFDFQELQINYAQKMHEYHSGDPDDLNYAFEEGQRKAHEDFQEITERFIGLDGYFERIQFRIPKLLQLLVNEIENITDILKSESIYENRSSINNTNKEF